MLSLQYVYMCKIHLLEYDSLIRILNEWSRSIYNFGALYVQRAMFEELLMRRLEHLLYREPGL